MQPVEQRASRRLGWLAAGLLVAGAAVLTGKALWDPDIAFLPSHGRAHWIVYPAPGETTARPRADLDAVFRRAFSVSGQVERARMRVRGFRRFQVRLNGAPVAQSTEGRSWKSASETEVGRWLHAGENQIEVTVANDDGPPALWLVLDWQGEGVGTGERWQVSWAGATWQPAALATAPMRGHGFDPDGLAWPLGQTLRTGWPAALATLGLAAVLAFVAWLYRLRPVVPSRLATKMVVLGAGAAWCGLFLHNHRWLDPVTGYDAWYHLQYIQHILDHGALPAANQSWQTYQPPLYYVLAALLLRLAGAGAMAADGVLILRLLGLGCGVANLFLVAACMRRLFPERTRPQVLGTLVAACLPSLLCLYQFPGNEMLLVTLASATLLIALWVLGQEDPPLGRYLLLGAAVGFALLAKVSALLLALAVLAALVLHGLRQPRPAHALAKLGLAVVVTLAICGWHYLRLWAEFGSPLVGNWDKALGLDWWQDPGYRTSADYLRFGRALAAPMFAGFAGVPDGVYASLWGDGLCSGAPSVGAAPPWSYPLMAMAMLAALLPSAALLIGGWIAVRAWRRRPGLAGTLLGTLAALVVGGFVFATLRVPSFAQAKASYGLLGLVPFCAAIAAGLDLPPARRPLVASLVNTAIALWALLAFASLWIRSESAPALIDRGTRAAVAGRRDDAAVLLARAATRDPHPWPARLELAQVLITGQASPESVAPWLALDGRPDLASRHQLLAAALGRHGRFDEALAEAQRGLRLDRDALPLHAMAAELLAARHDHLAAIASWREVLRLRPHSRMVHERLARLLDGLGDTGQAARHRVYAGRLPNELAGKR